MQSVNASPTVLDGPSTKSTTRSGSVLVVAIEPPSRAFLLRPIEVDAAVLTAEMLLPKPV